MFDRAILALALVSAVAVAGPSLACEMHQGGHANLTTAAAEPAPPAPPPVIETSTMPAPIIVEEPASMSPRYEQGAINCPHMRGKDQTVYLTN